MQSAAQSIIMRGVQLDRDKRYTESLVCYQEGIQLLINIVRTQSGEKAIYYRKKIEEYMNRAESIKLKIEELKEEGRYNEQIQIANDSINHGYDTIFDRFLDHEVKYVLIEDPFIRTHHQCQNLVRFFELVVKRCPEMRLAKLITREEPGDQSGWLEQIKVSLWDHGIAFTIDYSRTLHDRKITISNGWIIKIGRGLDYFKASEHKMGVGAFDMNLRKCHETTVDIFHSKTVKNM